MVYLLQVKGKIIVKKENLPERSPDAFFVKPSISPVLPAGIVQMNERGLWEWRSGEKTDKMVILLKP